jgi:cell division protein FtsI/penicillin-binding protein 2
MKRRLAVVTVLFVLAFFGITARLVAIQGFESGYWMERAKRIQEAEFTLVGSRGSIYDRNGVLLAQDIPALSIALDNYHMSQPEVIISLFQKHLGLSETELSEKIYKEGYFTWIARQIELSISQPLRQEAAELGVRGLIFFDEPKRIYPQNSLGSNVIGFVGLDQKGLEGVELSLDGWLHGQETTVRVVQTLSGIELVRETDAPENGGADVVLTLDSRMQRVAEEKLDEGVRRFAAKDGFAIVLNPRTGEILAMAQYKRYDLNHYGSAPTENRLNQAVAGAYEPGSLFKVFTGLAALETGAVTQNQLFDGDRKVTVAGHAFGNAEDNVKFGMVNLHGIIQNSVNIGMVHVAHHIGDVALYRYLQQIGMGRKTMVDLPGELPGTLIPIDNWSPLELGAVSIGQAVTVTGLQLASRLAAIANGGRVMKPYIMQKAQNLDGATLHQNHPKSVEQIASYNHANLMREMMESVVEAGTGMDAQLDNFSVAAKSGTAQKVVAGERGYSATKFISSFGGFFPSSNPEFFILVVLDEVKNYAPLTGPWGGGTAGTILKAIAERLVDLKQLHPTY